METLSYEVERFGIHAILIEPAFIRTNIDQNVVRAQQLIPAYAEDRRRAEKGLARSVAQGEDPSVVAETVWKALTYPKPRLRYLAGRQARRVRMLRTLMPASLFAMGLRRSLN
jgi:NAD(P)-dependent dehydrogenase (short-subunit alcohol dehydrogenase family)